jgi:RNA polymerase sigma-70 factor (ECF subfamily)
MNKNDTYCDKELLNAVREKGVAGWDLFCDQFDPLIESIARWPKWSFSEEEQKDVCQNIYMQLQTALPNFRQESSLSWFIKRIAISQCVNEIRRQVRWRRVMIPSIQKTPDGNWHEMEFENKEALDPHDEVVKKERQQTLHSALQHMGNACKESINLFYLQHFSYREISQQLGISVNTVGSRLAKCLGKLQKELRYHSELEGTNP